MKPIVAHFITDLDVGGAEKQLSIILPYLQESFENHVICAIGKGPIAQTLEQKHIPVHYLDLSSRNDPRVLFQLYRALKKLLPDVLITYLIYADITGRIIGRLTGVNKIICSQRSSLLERDYLRTLDKTTSNLVDVYTVQTRAHKHMLSKRLRVPMQKFFVIPNAAEIINRKKKIGRRKQLGFNDDDIIVTYVGHMKKGKGHNDLLLAASQISNLQFPISKSFHLLLVGDGVLRKQLEKEADTLGIKDNVYFPGKRDDVPELLAMSDIFVLPSHGEGMSNALLEAMAAGLPCVVSDIEVNKEIITDGGNGLLFKTKDVNDLSSQLQKLIMNADLRRQLGENTQEYARVNHNPQKIANQWSALLTHVMSL